MIYVGVDPGVSGGIAIIEDGQLPQVFKMPGTERDLLDILGPSMANGRALESIHETHAVLERVSASPQMGVVSAFTFGKGYGAIRMALTAAYIPFDEVSPLKWQTVMGCRTKGDKNITKRRAQALFPETRITHAIADALLLAEYCRRVHRGIK